MISRKACSITQTEFRGLRRLPKMRALFAKFIDEAHQGEDLTDVYGQTHSPECPAHVPGVTPVTGILESDFMDDCLPVTRFVFHTRIGDLYDTTRKGEWCEDPVFESWVFCQRNPEYIGATATALMGLAAVAVRRHMSRVREQHPVSLQIIPVVSGAASL